MADHERSNGAGGATGSVTFEGRLLALPDDAPRCGDIKVAVAYNFSVDKIIAGTYQQASAVVLVACPDLKGDHFFEAGSRYLVEASRDLDESRSYTVYNGYGGSDLLWGVRVERM